MPPAAARFVGNHTRREAEMPPSATTTGAPAGPASRQATDTDSSVPPKCSLISPGTASTPSRTRLEAGGDGLVAQVVT